VVSAASPKALFSAADAAPGLSAVAEEAEKRIHRAVANA
jgi:hypothetical protein